MEAIQLSQLPIWESIIKYLDPLCIQSLGNLNKRIQGVKNQVVIHLTVHDDVNIILPLLIRYPNLASLDMGYLVEEKIKILPIFPKIKSLKLRQYGLIHLEVKYLLNIEKLDISESSYLDTIFKHLKNIPNLKYLDISGHESHRYNKILNILFKMPLLSTIIMRDIPNKLPYPPFEKLCKNSKIERLDFSNCHFIPGVKDIFNECQHIEIII